MIILNQGKEKRDNATHRPTLTLSQRPRGIGKDTKDGKSWGKAMHKTQTLPETSGLSELTEPIWLHGKAAEQSKREAISGCEKNLNCSLNRHRLGAGSMTGHLVV